MNALKLLTLAMPLSLLVACGGGGGGGGGSEAGPQDTTPRKQGEACANAVTGAGCVEGLSCMKRFSSQAPTQTCQAPGNQQRAEVCDQAAGNCAVGHACALLTGAAQAVCHKVCDPKTSVGCEAVPDHKCSEVGLCVAVPACDPVNVGATCAPTKTCALAKPPACVDFGAVVEGAACSESARCARTLTCIATTSGDVTENICRKACKVNADCPDATTQYCKMIEGFDYGICLKKT